MMYVLKCLFMSTPLIYSRTAAALCSSISEEAPVAPSGQVEI